MKKQIAGLVIGVASGAALLTAFGNDGTGHTGPGTVYSGSANGYVSQVTANVTVHNGGIRTISFEHSESSFVSPLLEDLLEAIIASQNTNINATDIMAGATSSANAAISAVNSALVSAGLLEYENTNLASDVEDTSSETVGTPSSVISVGDTSGFAAISQSASVTGYRGQLYTEVFLNDNGELIGIQVSHDETPFIASPVLESMVNQIFSNGGSYTNIDIMAEATVSANALIESMALISQLVDITSTVD
ncbi:MAG: FMN-binding protein [Defluviitaleaceae bacterium]|nr:FMN-binding protein [Defluviitaleaceae bacterium]